MKRFSLFECNLNTLTVYQEDPPDQVNQTEVLFWGKNMDTLNIYTLPFPIEQKTNPHFIRSKF